MDDAGKPVASTLEDQQDAAWPKNPLSATAMLEDIQRMAKNVASQLRAKLGDKIYEGVNLAVELEHAINQHVNEVLDGQYRT